MEARNVGWWRAGARVGEVGVGVGCDERLSLYPEYSGTMIDAMVDLILNATAVDA